MNVEDDNKALAVLCSEAKVVKFTIRTNLKFIKYQEYYSTTEKKLNVPEKEKINEAELINTLLR